MVWGTGKIKREKEKKEIPPIRYQIKNCFKKDKNKTKMQKIHLYFLLEKSVFVQVSCPCPGCYGNSLGVGGVAPLA
jgi:hypothetical protein